jgi:hypothetical protein
MGVGPLLILSRMIFSGKEESVWPTANLISERKLDKTDSDRTAGLAQPDPAGQGEPRTVRKQSELTASTIY